MERVFPGFSFMVTRSNNTIHVDNNNRWELEEWKVGKIILVYEEANQPT